MPRLLCLLRHSADFLHSELRMGSRPAQAYLAIWPHRLENTGRLHSRFCDHQTTDGYIWLATLTGLERFDGVKFTPWTPPKGQKLPRGSGALLGAQDGSLWIGTPGGLAQLKDGELFNYTSEIGGASVNGVIEDHTGTIWFTRSRVRDGRGPLCRIVDRHAQCYGRRMVFRLGLASI